MSCFIERASFRISPRKRVRPCLGFPWLCILFLSGAALGQEAKLDGRVFDDKDKPVPAIRVIAAGGQATVTDAKGHFAINFPRSILPGQAARIEVARSNWVIFQPILGDCVTQSTERNYEPLRVVIVPKGSPLALSPKRLSQVIAQWTAERVKLRAEVGTLKQNVDEYAFLRQYANEYGFTMEQFREAAEQWAQIKDSDDKEERALKEFWHRNYGKAAQLARESAQVADEELRQANKNTKLASLKVIRRYKLEGNSYFVQFKFREALDAYSEIEQRFDTGDLSKTNLTAELAEIRFLIGNAKEELGERVEGDEGPRLLKEALDAYYKTATFYTREQSPQAWSAAQNNLGIVLWSLGERVSGAESIKYLNDAVAAYRAVLEVTTRAQVPQDWAGTQNNLGLVLASLGGRASGAESIKYLNDAIEAYHAALEVRTRDRVPQDWAATQTNLGLVLASLGERVSGAENMKYLSDAVAAYRAALEVSTRNELPQQWATTQNSLGNVLASLGGRVNGAEGFKYLNDAVTAYRAALEVRTRDQLPQQWATTLTNMGSVMRIIGERVSGAEGIKYLNSAVATYRAALEVRTRDQLPQDWATTQTSLGIGLRMLGERVSGAEGIKYLNDAVAAFRAALEVRTRDQLPQQWATVQNNLGVGLQALGERLGGEEGERLLAQAVESYRQALTIFNRETLPQQWALTQYNLAKTYLRLRNWLGAAQSYVNILTYDPDFEEAYITASALYHDRLFKFEEAFSLSQQWMIRHPNDISAQADFAEAHFTIGRFPECGQRINALLAKPEVTVGTKTALRAIEIASLLADNKASEVPVKLGASIAEITRQPGDFKLTWEFDGTRHFINQNEKLLPYRPWLGELFDALAAKDRDSMLKALEDVRTKFKEAR